ncbi:FG-GAP-like repeat-containing protein [Micromonospora zamorensis]|uniref:FG-GAP-like repeat-containing protein n=2 Tax=Micromonospora zamorensis TaxID=709883 RepID=UPI00081F7F4C|nr:trypsin-like serine protease [Micromonospora zamorensis]SCG71527.1 Secreted trypsin-like serine protease [Micromonospora zamorensis]
MSSTHHRLTRSAVLLVTAIAASLLNAGSSQAVGAGTAVTDGSFAFAAKIDVGPGLRGCSGALVNPYWVLTAKSCFSVDGQPVAAGAPAKPTTVTVGRPDLTTSTGAVVSALRLVPHADRDVVLVRLSRRVAVTPIALASSAPAVGEQLTVAGFGRTATEWVPDQLHAGPFTVQDVSANSVGMVGAGQSVICRGDLGGPTVRLVGGQPQLVALHRTSWQGGCLGETEARRDAVETRVDDLASWITANSPAGATDRNTDFNGDGRDDALMVYRHKDTSIQFFTSLSDATGGFGPFLGSYTVPANSWGWDSFRTITGDYNGDGRSDAAVMYAHGDGRFSMSTSLANADGGFGPFTTSLTVPATAKWVSDSIRLTSGDFNGDGRDDALMVYRHKDTSIQFFTSLSDATGGFGPFLGSYTVPANSWGWDSFRTITGDYNGDGRSDAAVMYAHGDGRFSMSTSLANADGGFGPFTTSLTVPATAKWVSDSIRLTSGDFNGDGRDDALMVYRHKDTSIQFFTSLSDATGGFGPFLGSYTVPANSWGWDSFRTITGDYNGDGRSDAAVMYAHGDGRFSMSTSLANADGGFGPFTTSLTVPATAKWVSDSIRLF